MNATSGRKSGTRSRRPCFPPKSNVNPMSVASACVPSVAIAAPETLIAGTGPQPKINSGSSTRFKSTVTSTIIIGTPTIPNPRINEAYTKKPNTKMKPRNVIWRNLTASGSTAGVAPMNRMIGSLKTYPTDESNSETNSTINSVCAATWFIARSSPRPLYWAISTVPAIGNPPPMAIIRNVSGKQSETAATASALSRPTQNVSVI